MLRTTQRHSFRPRHCLCLPVFCWCGRGIARCLERVAAENHYNTMDKITSEIEGGKPALKPTETVDKSAPVIEGVCFAPHSFPCIPRL